MMNLQTCIMQKKFLNSSLLFLKMYMQVLLVLKTKIKFFKSVFST